MAVRQAAAGTTADADAGTPEILGHCRGIDNQAHPESRVLVFEVVPELHGSEYERALLQAQIAASTVPLHAKPDYANGHLRALLESVGGVLVQLMPPWRYEVNVQLKGWSKALLAAERERATSERLRVVPARSLPLTQLCELEAEHYIAQHASWSPAASREKMLEYFATEHDPASEDSWNREHSFAVINESAELVGAALVWAGAGIQTDPPELVHLSRPYSSPEAWRAKLLAIAAVADVLPEGSMICIDSHLSMREEYAAIGSIPGLDRSSPEWTAIVAIPVPGGPDPIPLDAALIPEAAGWARQFITQ